MKYSYNSPLTSLDQFFQFILTLNKQTSPILSIAFLLACLKISILN